MKILIFKRLFTAAILCAVVFSACKQEPAPQKKITVTGIPAQYNGKIGITALAQSASSDTAAMSNFASINGGTVTMSLFEDADETIPFIGSGTYMVMFFIMDSINSSAFSYAGAIFSRSISDETTTIPFSEFIDFTSSVRQTPFNVRDVLPEILKLYE
jgi:hypothetical protein